MLPSSTPWGGIVTCKVRGITAPTCFQKFLLLKAPRTIQTSRLHRLAPLPIPGDPQKRSKKFKLPPVSFIMSKNCCWARGIRITVRSIWRVPKTNNTWCTSFKEIMTPKKTKTTMSLTSGLLRSIKNKVQMFRNKRSLMWGYIIPRAYSHNKTNIINQNRELSLKSYWIHSIGVLPKSSRSEAYFLRLCSRWPHQSSWKSTTLEGFLCLSQRHQILKDN